MQWKWSLEKEVNWEGGRGEQIHQGLHVIICNQLLLGCSLQAACTASLSFSSTLTHLEIQVIGMGQTWKLHVSPRGLATLLLSFPLLLNHGLFRRVFPKVGGTAPWEMVGLHGVP